MNIDESASSVAQATAAVDLIAADSHSNVIRVLAAEEILHVSGGPETVIGTGTTPPH